MTTTVYHYPRCSTCRKALKWLEENSVEFTPRDIATQPPSVATLRSVLSKSGLEIKKLFNTSGEVYRQEGYKERLLTMTDAEALAALSANGKLIKRPLVVGDDFALVGFDAERYESALRG